MVKLYYVDADILESLARDHARTRDDLKALLKSCEWRVNGTPHRGWDTGTWGNVRSTLGNELGLLEDDRRALGSRAAVVREKARESVLAQLKGWLESIWHKAKAKVETAVDHLAAIAEAAIIGIQQKAWSAFQSLQNLLTEADELRQKAQAWLAHLMGISGQIVLSITHHTWELLQTMKQLVDEAERLREEARAALDRLASVAIDTVIGAGQQAWKTVQSVATALIFPSDGWQVTTVRYSVTGPLHEFGIPASGKLEVTRTIKSRQNGDGTVTIVITEEYELDLVAKADLEVLEAGAEAGIRLTRERELTFGSLAEGKWALATFLAVPPSPTPLSVVDVWSVGHTVRDGFTISQTGELEAEVSDGLFKLAGVEAGGARGLGAETRINDAGNLEMATYVDLEGQGSLDLVGTEGELTCDARFALVTDGDRAYSELTFELKTELGVSLADFNTAFGLEIEVGTVESYDSITLKIVTPTDELAEEVARLLKSGDVVGAVSRLEDASHITVVGVLGVETELIDAGFERTPVPTATIGAEVEVSTAHETEVVLYDSDSRGVGGGGGGGGGAW
jgi:hypothetical protein